MTIQYDRKSFMINGQRVFLNSAAIHYFRMPKEEWREVLLKAKLAGMNCIDTYFAWNVHEATEGSFDFTGDNDCGEFLDLCAELGLWVIARPGPFICAEWDFGGFPWWLATKEGIEYRIDNDVYLNYVFRYFDQLLPIIAARQITRGGSVILVQVENEYGYLAETERGKNYMKILRDSLLARDIDVPLITCVGGLEETIECANYWSGAKQHYDRLVEKQPDTPKMVTEFWTGWFEHWGGMAALQKTAPLYEKRMLETVAAGFDGINHYMFFGGTNFASYGGRTVGDSDIFMITSYDYHAPLDEFGRATDKYFTAKKVSQFTNVLSQFLLNAEEGDVSAIKTSGQLKLSALQLEDGQRLLFAESEKDERDLFYLNLEVVLPVVIEAGHMLPVLDRVRVMQGLRLSMGGYLIGNESYDNRQVLIIAGGKGHRLSLLLEVDETASEAGGSSVHELLWLQEQASVVRYEWLRERTQLLLDLYLFEEAQVLQFKLGERVIELVVLNEAAAAQAWKLQHSATDWAIGFKDIAIMPDGKLEGVRDDNRLPLYINEQQTVIASHLKLATKTTVPLPSLSNWSSTVLPLEAANGQFYAEPQGFASVGLDYGYLLYTHELECHAEQNTTLALTAIQDTARVFVNGIDQGVIKDLGAGSKVVKLQQGRNSIQFLVQHMGRLNFSPYLGEEKGIFGTVYRDAEVHDFRDHWMIEGRQHHIAQVTAGSSEGTATIGASMCKTFYVEPNKRVILVGVISEKLVINGSEVILPGYANWFKFHSVDITSYVQAGENHIEMQLVDSPVSRLQLIVCDEQRRLDGWRISSLGRSDWSEAQDKTPTEIRSAVQGPAWHSASFQWQPSDKDSRIRLKLRMTGMSKGYILLNGKSAGRYWQIGPQEDYKLPIAWLKQGENKLEIFDEQGNLPQAVRLLFDKHTSRVWTKLD